MKRKEERDRERGGRKRREELCPERNRNKSDTHSYTSLQKFDKTSSKTTVSMCESVYQNISGPDSHRCSEQRLLDGKPRGLDLCSSPHETCASGQAASLAQASVCSSVNGSDHDASLGTVPETLTHRGLLIFAKICMAYAMCRTQS